MSKSKCSNSSDWPIHKSAAINSQSNEDRCFQYALEFTRHHTKSKNGCEGVDYLLKNIIETVYTIQGILYVDE